MVEKIGAGKPVEGEADWAVTGAFEWNGDTISARLQLVNINMPRITTILRERRRSLWQAGGGESSESSVLE